MAGEKPQEWEQCWSPEKIRQQSTKWNLAGDAGLLLYLRQVSTELCNRIDLTKHQMGILSDETTRTTSRLESSISDYTRLANSQFIENRVYDDDTKINRDFEVKQEMPKTKEEREAQYVSTIRQALETGCAMIDSHFTKIDVKPVDFDEDDDPSFKPQPIFEPKDPHSDRMLPYIIGTTDFMRSEYVGLREDEEDEIHAKKQTEISSESDEETITPITSPRANIERQRQLEVPAAKLIPEIRAPSADDKNASDSSSSGLFGTSADSTENILSNAMSSSEKTLQYAEQAVPQRQNDFRSELTKKLEASKTLDSTSATGATTQNAKPTSVSQSGPSVNNYANDGTLIAPPPLLPRQRKMDDSDDEGGLFKQRSRGLFDDDDDEEEHKPVSLPRGRLQQLATSATETLLPRKTDQPPSVPVTEKSRPDAQQPSIASNTSISTSKISAVPKPKMASMFSSDNEDDDDDLFGKVYKQKSPAPTVTSPPSNQPSIDIKKADNIKGASSSQPVSSGRIGTSLFDDADDDEDDLFTILKRPKEPVIQKPKDLFSEGLANDGKANFGSSSISSALLKIEEPTIGKTIPIVAEDIPKVVKDTTQTISDPKPPPPSLPLDRGMVGQKNTRPVGTSLFGDSDDDLFGKPESIKGDIVKSSAVETNRVEKNDFRNDLAKKLLAGPQTSGLVKLTRTTEESQNAVEDHAQFLPQPEKPPEKVEVVKESISKSEALMGINEGFNKEQAITFDGSSGSVETLPTLQKNRASLPQRRPPSKNINRRPPDENGVEPSSVVVSSLPVERTPKVADPLKPIIADPLSIGSTSSSINILVPAPENVQDKPAVMEKKEKKVETKIKSRASLFDDDDDDLFGSIGKVTETKRAVPVKVEEKTKVNQPAPEIKKVAPVSSSAASNLFSDDDDEDLFSSIKIVKTTVPVAKKSQIPVVEEDIFASTPTSTQTKQALQKPPAQANKGRNLFDDDDDDVDIFR